MFTILIQEKGGEQRRMVFNKAEVTIGRVQGNDIVLPKGNVSKRHARIVLKDGKFIIVDLKSTNGTYVNGRKITSPLVVKDSDKIYIGDFIVGVDEAASGVEGDGPSESITSPPQPASAGMGGAPDVRPPRPTEAQPMANMPGAMMGNADPVNAPSQMATPPRAAPPRPAPAPPRDMGGDPGPMGAGPGMGGPGPAPGPRSMPPIGAPPPGRNAGRPGGTMPPPVSGNPNMAGSSLSGSMVPPPIEAPPPMAPPPMAPPPMAAMAPPPVAPMAAPTVATPPTRSAPMPAPASDPLAGTLGGVGGPAPVLPMRQPNAANGASKSGPVLGSVVPVASSSGSFAASSGVTKQRTSRGVSAPNRRGVQLEALDPKVTKMLDLQSNILERLRAKLDLDKIPFERLHEEELWQRAERATIDLVEALDGSGELPKYIDQDTLIKETLSEALALGPLEDLLADENIDEIIIDRRDRVVVGKNGIMRGSGKAFSSDDVFERVVKRLVAEAGERIDEMVPLVDLRMRDGTRLTAAIAPVAARGACLVLRKPLSPSPSLQDLGSQGAMSPGMADFLSTCIAARRNILVVGAPGSGRTAMLGALASASPAGERVVSIEDVGELALGRDEWVQLESRSGNAKVPSVRLDSLLDTALRLMPDRLVIGEVRGEEALPLVYALNANIDGAVVAMSGDGAQVALSRIATLARAGGATESAIRELVAQAFDIIVHVARMPDNRVKVVAIEEVLGFSDVAFETHVLFQQQGAGFGPTGHVPRFYSELEARGIPADQAVFR
ncbi:MAG TPA: ATPase, T2SS/T4P/T4SS family [Kofleriaceae bacterium]|jgi:pilus assembly protein CpaF